MVRAQCWACFERKRDYVYRPSGMPVSECSNIFGKEANRNQARNKGPKEGTIPRALNHYRGAESLRRISNVNTAEIVVYYKRKKYNILYNNLTQRYLRKTVVEVGKLVYSI